MDMYRCKVCKTTCQENEIILTVNKEGEWVLHCPKCNSEILELVNEITQSPHSLKTYYELEEYDNDN